MDIPTVLYCLAKYWFGFEDDLHHHRSSFHVHHWLANLLRDLYLNGGSLSLMNENSHQQIKLTCGLSIRKYSTYLSIHRPRMLTTTTREFHVPPPPPAKYLISNHILEASARRAGRQAGKQADQTACSVIRVPRQRQFSRIVATHKLLSDKFASLSIKPLKKKKKEKDRLEIKGYVANTPRVVSLIKGEILVPTKWSVKLSPFPIPSNCRRNCNRSSCLVNEWNWKSCPRRSFRVSLFLCPFLSIDWKQEEGLFPAINLQ